MQAKAATTRSKQRRVTQMSKDSVYDHMEESEKLVASYLRELNIWWIYESPVFVYDEKGRPRVWTPDFYLPKLGIYIEVCGGRNDKSYGFREEIYKKNDIFVIFVHLSARAESGRCSHNSRRSIFKSRKLSIMKSASERSWLPLCRFLYPTHFIPACFAA